MKKILLIAFALFTMNSFAQTTMFKANSFNGLKSENNVKFETSKRVNLKKASSPNNAKAQAAPEGTTKAYYADYGESVDQIDVLQRAHVKYNIVFGEDGTVSVPNMFLRSVVGEDVYLKGTYNEATNEITINNNQEIYNEDGLSLYVCSVDAETSEPSTSTNFKLTVDPETGIISSAENEYLGAYLSDGSQTILYTYCTMFYYYPEDLFPAAVTRDYTYNDYYGNSQKTTVDIVNVGDVFYIKNLMPEHPEAWMAGSMDGENLVVYSYMVGDDDLALLFVNGSNFVDTCTLTYNSSSDSYTSENGVDLVDYFYYYGDSQNQEGFYLTGSCSDMVIKGKTTAISNIENGNNKVVSTEYFDLSGRRISNAAQGISIMVNKYADGTSKAVKIMK